MEAKVTPREANAMDPTHRMLLEATYEGFENAGLTLQDVSGTRTSVYIGTFTGDFPNLQARDNEGPSIYRTSSHLPSFQSAERVKMPLGFHHRWHRTDCRGSTTCEGLHSL